MNLKVLKLLRLCHLLNKPAYKKLCAVEVIRHSRFFDAEWYQKTYALSPDINLAQHYLENGSKKGLNPSSKFSTSEYLKFCPDVAASGVNPLVHYELFGKNEGRMPLLDMQNVFNSYGWGYHLLRKGVHWLYKRQIRRNHHARILVHVHLYYVYAWAEIKEYLDNLIGYSYKLIVTYPKESYDEKIISAIKKYKKDSKIICLDNKGFDIGPFLEVLREIDLDKYDIVYHLHTKSITQKAQYAYGRLFKGKSWFYQCFSGTLGIFNVHKGIDLLLNQKGTGIVAAKNLIFTDDPERQSLVSEYAKRLGIVVPKNYVFIGGSCFGIKSKALKKIQKLNLSINSFHPSQRHIFSLAHAMERIIPVIVLNAGLKIQGLRTLYNNHPVQIWRANKKSQKQQKVLFKRLQQYGLGGLKALKSDAPSGLGCSFLFGIYKGQEVFIKYGGDVAIAENEYHCQKQFKKLLGPYVPDVLMYNPEPFVVMAYLPGYNLEELINFGLTDDEKKNILSQLKDLKQKLKTAPLLHRDIRPANLLYSDGILRLIDFQFAVKKTANGDFQELPYLEQNPQTLSVLGEEFRAASGQFDDVASVEKIIQLIGRG